jgi:hypothetical protein
LTSSSVIIISFFFAFLKSLYIYLIPSVMEFATPDKGGLPSTETPARVASRKDEDVELDELAAVLAKYRGTMADHKDMSALGKKQVLLVGCFLGTLYLRSQLD